MVVKRNILRLLLLKHGMLVDNTVKIIAGIDAILSFNNVYFFAKGNQFWISNKENQDEQYY